MAKDTKKSILEEAVNDLKKIIETADKNAMKKLAKQFPKNFDALLKEELNNNNNNKESKEPIVEGKNKESVKDKKDEVNESVEDMTEMAMDEVEAAYEAANPDDKFEVEINPEGEETDIEITMSDIEKELAEMEGAANEMEEANYNAENQGDPFEKIKGIFNQLGEMVKEMEDQKMHEEYKGMFEQHMKETYGEAYASTLGEEKCNELYEMFCAHKNSEPYGDTSHAAPNVNESEDKPFEEKSTPSNEQGHAISENDDKEEKEHHEEEKEEKVDEMHEKGGVGSNPDKGQDTTPKGIEEDSAEEKEEKREDGDDVDEAHGSTLAQNKKVDGNLQPRVPDYAQYKKNKVRYALRNENYEKRMDSLIEENKKVTKELNEMKSEFGKAETIVENYRNALEKYRTQLAEMAVFNTNLANVNNLLVNEELALTKEDKVNIINKFKSVNSLSESENVYNDVLLEMKEGKKTISENVEEKINGDVVGESTGAKKIDEAVERTAFESTEHVNKIKNIMEYVEKGKRI